ncbi:MAG: sulfur carrier protein ThiS [Candidatus Eutrophobiaceae bacterium]
MTIILNGAEFALSGGASVRALLDSLGERGQLAVEVNCHVVPRSAWIDHFLCPGDRVELVRAVGGG